MSLIELLKQPWFYQSPNPLTILSWILMAAYGSGQLLKNGVKFKRAPRLIAFINAGFIAGIIVLIQDLFFLVITAIRWIPIYPQYATLDFWLCFPRDLAGLALCIILTWDLYGLYSLKNSQTWLGFAELWIITILIFIFTPTMGITNWTFAITQGMSNQIILIAFILNFLFGKPILFIIYTTLWRKKEYGKDKKNRFEPSV
jgi:hypothetical protein